MVWELHSWITDRQTAFQLYIVDVVLLRPTILKHAGEFPPSPQGNSRNFGDKFPNFQLYSHLNFWGGGHAFPFLKIVYSEIESDNTFHQKNP